VKGDRKRKGGELGRQRRKFTRNHSIEKEKKRTRPKSSNEGNSKNQPLSRLDHKTRDVDKELQRRSSGAGYKRKVFLTLITKREAGKK